MGLWDNDREFFRYLISKVVQTTPSDVAPDVYADNCFARAVKIYEKVKEFEQNGSTDNHPCVQGKSS